MRLRDYATGMAAYNRWMNEKVYAAAAELTDEERKRDLGAAFGSVHGTLNHLLLGDRSWLQRFRGEPVTMKSPDEEVYADFEELRAARIRMDDELAAWAASLDDAFGDATFSAYSVTMARHFTMPGWVAVAHVFNHQAHHRGQLTTLLAQLGKDAGVTDLPWAPVFQDPAATEAARSGPNG
jgi:uncharacterized damage-inducible protein DinB